MKRKPGSAIWARLAALEKSARGASRGWQERVAEWKRTRVLDYDGPDAEHWRELAKRQREHAASLQELDCVDPNE